MTFYTTPLLLKVNFYCYSKEEDEEEKEGFDNVYPILLYCFRRSDKVTNYRSYDPVRIRHREAERERVL